MTSLNMAPLRLGAFATFRRGMRLSPEFRRGLGVTLTLTLVATAGRVVVPIAIQQIIDHGLPTSGKPNIPLIRNAVLLAAGAVLLTAVSASWMNVRLYRSTESGLATLRVKAFRHIHDLSMLHQASERRGSLVSRVTSDVDQISTFMQWGGLLLVVSAAQVVVATVIMAYYSWQLTVLVYACFVPLVLLIRHLQPGIRAAYGRVRERVGDVLGAVAESVVGASVIKAYGSEARTASRVDHAIDQHVKAAIKAQIMTSSTFTTGELVSSLANAAIVVVGIELGLNGQLSAGRLVAFLFLVTLFVSPVQAATETLNDAQNALAGWGRVIEILDTPTDVADPGAEGHDLPPGPLDVRFDHVHFAYPGGPEVLTDINLEIAPRTGVAIVGETGSGKTTFAKLLTRLMDPVSGGILLSGVPLRDVRFSSLRSRVVMVPQDGFLFDTTIGANVRYGRPGASDADLLRAFDELALTDWLEGLEKGLDTRVGERGGSLSAGERQLVALARAYLADPDLLVLDEATSAVDPATEVRLSRAFDGLTTGRTTITIAHRLSTAEVADEVVVVDAGRVVQRGSHAELVAVPGRYAELHRSWSANKGSAA
jgi:ATP-binding cassette subfamily B protein